MRRFDSKCTTHVLLPALVSIVLAFVVIQAAGAQEATDSATVSFTTEIAPILEQHCLGCHSPGIRKGDLSLATAGDLIDIGYIVAHDPDSSYLLDLITGSDESPPAMPQDGEPLTDEQLTLIRRWILEGADWPEQVVLQERSKVDASWWSLQPLSRQAPPIADEAPDAWQSNPIDRFVWSRLDEQELSPSPRADRRTLIRRASYDLLGLPPSPEEVEAFVSDADPQAYEKLIDRLLDSPHYGERWGRHWLDVVRFGESNGFERNVINDHMWPFRDYVIRSLNADKPFDELLREHLAGDVIAPGEPEKEIGSMFLVAGPYDDVTNQDPIQAAQIRANTIDEMIRSTSEAFLGLTIGCARCHDHKFDPIRQRDYYSLYATFSAVRHGNRVVATSEEQAAHAAKVGPLQERRDELTSQRDTVKNEILQRALSRLDDYQQRWSREPVSRLGTEESFPPITARFVRLVSEGQDANPADRHNFKIDEFEVWSTGEDARNVALASAGATASGSSPQIKDFPGAYGPHLVIDGKFGERMFANGGQVTIELAAAQEINRVLISSARGEQNPESGLFVFLADYRIEVSTDGTHWTRVADSHDRRPVNQAHRDHRLRALEMTDQERQQIAELDQQIAAVNRQLAAVPPLMTVAVGHRSADDAKGPFHVFLGGDPQRLGEEVVPASLAVFEPVVAPYRMSATSEEGQRRLTLANWMVHDDNPLTPRVLVNRIWHYHFGHGIVDTPSDFGYMGGKPTHPDLLDWLARQLRRHDWRIKPLHKLIMTSQTYQQATTYRAAAARRDGDSRLLWRFPPRRLSAEEIRDTMLVVAGQLDDRMGGPGFRLYQFMQDNVCTYVPLDKHGPETYRRAVYHQNARASVVDLMTEFDQPDCAFSTPRRAATTTPLQALTLLNHSFTLDMAQSLAQRLEREAGKDVDRQLDRAFQLCFLRTPSSEERGVCRELVQKFGLPALCRVILNSSELVYLE
jgi:mono/diheme cytochrome c family protein